MKPRFCQQNKQKYHSSYNVVMLLIRYNKQNFIILHMTILYQESISMQQQTLNGKVALITGSARRIGATTAEYLHDAGMSIIIHYANSHEEAHQLAAVFNQKRADSAKLLQV